MPGFCMCACLCAHPRYLGSACVPDYKGCVWMCVHVSQVLGGVPASVSWMPGFCVLDTWVARVCVHLSDAWGRGRCPKCLGSPRVLRPKHLGSECTWVCSRQVCVGVFAHVPDTWVVCARVHACAHARVPQTQRVGHLYPHGGVCGEYVCVHAHACVC